MLQFPYMGTKHALAPIVAETARQSGSGPFLDVFAGMCSVARSVQIDRPVWTNDLQQFAVYAAKAMLCDTRGQAEELDFEVPFRRHFKNLSDRFRDALRQERLALASGSFEQFAARSSCVEASIDRRPARPFDLFVTIYSNTYIGLEQAMEIDALLYALNEVAPRGRADQAPVRRRYLFALGRTLLRVSTTTGHFAQFQTISERNWKRFQRTRRSSVLDFFKVDYLSTFEQISCAPTRNRAFNMDAISLLRSLRRTKNMPAIVYADPPYKQDQYSRYYHLLETLILYDYPKVTGKAKYRAERTSSVFSSKSKSRRGIEAISSLTSGIRAVFDRYESLRDSLGARFLIQNLCW